jgi:RNA polymerase sigma factor (sigma-70 family)
MQFEDTVVPHAPYIHRLLSHWCGNSSDIEDIEQEVLLKIYLKLDQFRGEADIKSWIYRITLNTMYSFYKSRQRKSENLEEDLDIFVYPERDLADGVSFRDLLFKIKNFVAIMPDKYRMVFELVILRDFSYIDAGKAMGVSARYIGVVLTRLRKNIQGEFKSSWILIQ